ncbi:MAG: hypothetical protein M3P27_03010 [Acidobacteriota bacterium]|nr:hypothetical protein [Acidobacteriota bacterium]
MNFQPLKPEAAVQRAVLDLLAAERILAYRMNSGALLGASGRPVSFGVKGMADVLAFPKVQCSSLTYCRFSRNLWIECKSATGRQSPEQVSFQQQVEADGHAYIIARSSDDVLAWLREHGAIGST